MTRRCWSAGTLAVVTAYAVGIGLVGLRRPRLAFAGIALFGLVGAVAAATGPAGGPLDAIPSLAGALAGVVALRALLARLAVPQEGGGRPPLRAPRWTVAGSSWPVGSPSVRPPWPGEVAGCCNAASSSPGNAPGSRSRHRPRRRPPCRPERICPGRWPA